MKCFAAGLLLLLSSAACVSTPLSPGMPGGASLPRSVRVQLTEQGTTVIREVPLEDYVQATAISEFAPAAGEIATVERMLEVQAIVSRTYALSHLARHTREGFDLCSTTHCQLFDPRRLKTSKWAAASAEAVTRTRGLILTFEQQPIQALFHADCGGHTSTAAAVWGGVDRPYLLARADAGAAGDAHAVWEYDTSLEALSAALDVKGRLETVAIAERDDAGRAERIAIRSRVGTDTTSTIVRGDQFRQILSRAFGARAVRSTMFEIRQRGATVTFAGRGFGHGVGLCQAGALARLRAGASPADVVRYYFPGAALGSTFQAQGSRLRAQAKPWTAHSKILLEP